MELIGTSKSHDSVFLDITKSPCFARLQKMRFKGFTRSLLSRRMNLVPCTRAQLVNQGTEEGAASQHGVKDQTQRGVGADPNKKEFGGSPRKEVLMKEGLGPPLSLDFNPLLIGSESKPRTYIVNVDLPTLPAITSNIWVAFSLIRLVNRMLLHLLSQTLSFALHTWKSEREMTRCHCCGKLHSRDFTVCSRCCMFCISKRSSWYLYTTQFRNNAAPEHDNRVGCWYMNK